MIIKGQKDKIEGMFLIVMRPGEVRPVNWQTIEFLITCEKCGQEMICKYYNSLDAMLANHVKFDCPKRINE